MSEAVVFSLLLILNMAALAITVILVPKITNSFIFGAICGFFLEVVRIGIAMAIVPEYWRPSELTVWLINLRLFNIPILVGLGAFVAAAGQNSVPAEHDITDGSRLEGDGTHHRLSLTFADDLDDPLIEDTLGQLEELGAKIADPQDSSYFINAPDRYLVPISKLLWSKKQEGVLDFVSD